MRKTLLFYFIFLQIACGFLKAQTPAFPTAEGFGKWATGGRGGKVVEVTNTLDDANGTTEGSLRWALKQYPSDPITIVFRVAGTIILVADIRAKRSGLTIAGQTAPGDGICIRGHKVNLGGSTNVIIRNVRFRIGLADDGSFVAGGSLGFENGSNWIIDHCTFGWSGEENTTIYDNTLTTVQWCILHEGLYACGHSKGARGYGCQWGGQSATYHHNLLAHNKSRSPRFNGARSNDLNVLIDFVNNVNYNWGGSGACYGGDLVEGQTHRCNFVNNYYKPGPAYPGTSSSYFVSASFNSSQTTNQIAVWYMAGNYMEGSANTSKNTDNTLGLDGSAYASKGISKTSLISSVPFTVPNPVTTESAADAFNSVLAKAGVFPRDTTERRIIYEVKTGTATGKGTTQQYLNSDGTTYSTNPYYGIVKGIIDNPVLAFGDTIAYPNYKTYHTITDNDHDGMDDAWELTCKLDPTNPDDRNKYTLEGYTFLEVYLNSLVGEPIDTALLRKTQTIKITSVGTKSYSETPFQLESIVTPTNYSVTYSVVSGPATVSGNTVTLTGVGQVVIAASQAGNTLYLPASDTVKFTVNKGTSVITWNNPNAIVYGVPLTDVQLNASVKGTKAAPVFFPSAGTILHSGTNTLNVTYNGDDLYEGATASVNILVNKASSSITWSQPASIPFGTALSATQLNATVTGTSAPAVYNPASGTVLSAGTHTLNVSFDSDMNYEGASKSVNIEVTNPTSYETLSASNVDVYPNPASDNLNVVVPDFTKGGTIKIINANGATVLTKSIDKKTIEIYLTKLPAGIYMVNIETPAKTIIKKIEKK